MLYTSQHIDLSLPHLIYPNKWQNISASLQDRLRFKHKLKKKHSNLLHIVTNLFHDKCNAASTQTSIFWLFTWYIGFLLLFFFFPMASKSTEMWKHHLRYWIHFHSLKHQTCETATMKVGRVVEGVTSVLKSISEWVCLWGRNCLSVQCFWRLGPFLTAQPDPGIYKPECNSGRIQEHLALGALFVFFLQQLQTSV